MGMSVLEITASALADTIAAKNAEIERMAEELCLLEDQADKDDVTISLLRGFLHGRHPELTLELARFVLDEWRNDDYGGDITNSALEALSSHRSMVDFAESETDIAADYRKNHKDFCNIADEFYSVIDEIKGGARSQTLDKDDIFTRLVKDLEMTVRTTNCLLAAGVKTIGKLVSLDPIEVIGISQLGKGSLKEIESRLSDLGLSLSMTEGDIKHFRSQ